MNVRQKSIFPLSSEGPLVIVIPRELDQLHLSAARKEADAEIRKNITQEAALCPAVAFVGISAFGSNRLAFYTGYVRDGKVRIEPPLDSADPDDPAPLHRWEHCDLRQPEDPRRFRKLADELMRTVYPEDPAPDEVWSFRVAATPAMLWGFGVAGGCFILLISTFVLRKLLV